MKDWCAISQDMLCLYMGERGISRTLDKNIPPEEGFLLFMSGTARGCLVQTVW